MFFSRRNRAEPAFSPKDNARTLHKNLEFTASEQYRLLRTNVKFTLPEDVKCPVLGVTSSIRGEGKSTTSINLAYVLAEKGSRVLLIDGDLRIPSVAGKLGMEKGQGLTDLLLGEEARLQSWRSAVHENWYILAAGDIPPNPSELMGSRRMEKLLTQMREKFDYIVIDLPPVNIVSDAVAIAHMLDGMILVIRENYTARKDLEQCVRQLQLADVKLLGCVMNDSGSSTGNNKKYKYKYSSYSAGEKK